MTPTPTPKILNWRQREAQWDWNLRILGLFSLCFNPNRSSFSPESTCSDGAQLLSLDNNRLYIRSGFTSASLFIILPVWDVQMDIL